MADLVFATRGQAELLAAQEAVRKKALETKREFDEAAKATGAWDSSMAKLKSSAESALRSVNTEQEKILDKIAKIQEAQEKGLIPPEAAKEAEDALARLRQQWIDIDEATVKAKEETEKLKAETESVEREHAKLKTTAESALRSIQTEEERILEQIEEIEQAMSKGLVPPAEAEAGLQRLRDRLEEVRGGTEEASSAGGKLGGVFAKAFDPTQIAKMVVGFVGVKAIIGQIREEFEDLQTAVDRRLASNLKPKEQGDQLATAAAAAAQAARVAEERQRERSAAVDDADAALAKAMRSGTPAEQARAREARETAKTAYDEAENNAIAARQVERSAAQQRDQFQATPAYQRAAAIANRQRIMEDLYDNFASMGDVTQVSTEEIQKLADVMREAGQGVLSRKLTELASRLDDGVISTDEFQKQLRILSDEVRGRVGVETVTQGDQVTVTAGRLRNDSELNENQRKQVEFLSKAVAALDEIKGGLRDGGFMVNGE